MNVLDQKMWDEFLAKGLPTRQDERWKYADLTILKNIKLTGAKRVEADYVRDYIDQRRLHCVMPEDAAIQLVFVNGFFMPTLSDLDKLPANVVARSMNQALVDQADLVKQYWYPGIDAMDYPFARLNTTMFTDGLFLYVPDGCEISAPIHLLSLAADDNEFLAQPHHLIALGANTKLTLLEESVALTKRAYMMNTVTTIVVGENADLDYYKIQNENRQAIHLAGTYIQQKKNSRAGVTYFSKGSAFARDELVIKLQETGADCRTAGFYHPEDDNQFIDHHIDITHQAPHSQSEMLFKGILDKKSKAVFNGRLCVKQDAQKILAYQANHNLLLSRDAEVYSKPELEIDADDVKCKHGATTGQIDQEALFYMRARGIAKAEAMTILLQGFAEEIFARVAHPGIKQRAQEVAL